MKSKLSKIKGKSNKPLSIKQRKYMKGVMSGLSKMKAAENAGYSKQVARDAKNKIESYPAIQEAFQIAMREAGIDDASIVRVLREGLDATDLKGKDAVEHPDFATRLKYVEYINKKRGLDDLTKLDITSGGKPISFGIAELLKDDSDEENNS